MEVELTEIKGLDQLSNTFCGNQQSILGARVLFQFSVVCGENLAANNRKNPLAARVPTEGAFDYRAERKNDKCDQLGKKNYRLKLDPGANAERAERAEKRFCAAKCLTFSHNTSCAGNLAQKLQYIPATDEIYM